MRFLQDLQDWLYRWHDNSVYHTFTYSRLPEDEPLGSKHLERVVKFNY